MKKNKWLFFLILQILSFNLFGQVVAKDNSKTKIHFIYYRKSNFLINDKGLYADTMFLKKSFDKLTYQLTKHPNDSTKTVGFIDLKFLTSKDQKRVINIFSNSNYKYDCYYNIKKNQTAMYITRIESDEVRLLLKKLFKDTYSHIYYNRIYINYNKIVKPNTIFQYGMYRRKQDNVLIKWYDENKIGGEFSITAGNLIYKDLIIANPNLERHVTPFFLFKNCDYGIQKIITYFDTIELISVNLE